MTFKVEPARNPADNPTDECAECYCSLVWIVVGVLLMVGPFILAVVVSAVFWNEPCQGAGNLLAVWLVVALAFDVVAFVMTAFSEEDCGKVMLVILLVFQAGWLVFGFTLLISNKCVSSANVLGVYSAIYFALSSVLFCGRVVHINK